MFQIPGVSIQILRGAELRGIYEYADDHEIVGSASLRCETQMTGV
jgi:hypothetical protein